MDREAQKTPQALVIDDDPALLGAVSAFLTDGGYAVRTASGGQEGVRLALECAPDVIILDVQMPDLDGYVVCHMLRGEPALRRTPIVMLTASMDPHLNREAYAAGAQACVPKPSGRDTLLNLIETVRIGMPSEKKKG